MINLTLKALLAGVISWLIWAFILMQPNPALWENGQRALFVVVWLCLLVSKLEIDVSVRNFRGRF